MTTTTKKQTTVKEVMVVNDSPGEECRIAILQDNHLEELYAERTATATNVGNIYKGRVTNVESAIQAAFVDYGEGQAGFLHISDLHPRYFPGQKQTERVGKKIPRRSRPPIQEALKRGDEVLVQVLKEGIGSKGPTLTSYLSVPGRLLVMMPDMDRVGVSRKVEDPEKRRQMRDILDTLKLPDGFGFILRTAGFGQTKTELTRDVAYLNRLWKVVAKRIDEVGAPCELYTESDLFVRTIRDILRPSIEEIVVDSDQAYERARTLLSVVAPRTAPTVVRYRLSVPIFHAFDIERQIELIHNRELPLPSGGKLVIEQTEALVAIDVNSGRSRRATDSETNAYRTNCEAVDEICRQLRLRDLGGLVINDLIDMRALRHRRDIEDRFRTGLARDRARTMLLRISDFGICELTRQRMRPSLRKSHFMPCQQCDGHGEIKAPESVGADATRQLGYLLQFDRVHRIEMVCSPRVASVLLSGKRRELVRLEDTSGKKIGVRVSDTIAIDRVDFYAYDERNADVDIAKLPVSRVPTLKELQAAESRPPAQPAADTAAAPARRRRRSSKPAPADAVAIALETAAEEAAAIEAEVSAAKGPARKKKRSRRRSQRGRRDVATTPAAAEPEAPREAPRPAAEEPSLQPAAEQTPPELAPEKDGKVQRPAARDGSVRVHQLAREMGVPSRNIIRLCFDVCVKTVKNHMSSISRDNAEEIRRAIVPTDGTGDQIEPAPETVAETAVVDEAEKPQKRTRRRRGGRRRGGRGRGGKPGAETRTQPVAPERAADSVESAESAKPAESARPDEAARKKRSRRRRRTAAPGSTPSVSAATSSVESGPAPAPAGTAATSVETTRKTSPAIATNGASSKDRPGTAPKRRRGVYGRGRRTLSRSAGQQGMQDPDE